MSKTVYDEYVGAKFAYDLDLKGSISSYDDRVCVCVSVWRSFLRSVAD